MTLSPRTLAWPETLIALGLLAFAGLALFQTWAIPVSPLYSRVGPTVLPYLTTGGLALLALFLLKDAVQGGWQPEEEAEVAIDGRAVAFVVAGLLLNVALIGTLGFTLASTGLFTLVAYGFGSRKPLRDAAIGFSLALVAYFGFARLLGVNIGAGLVERLVGG